ncbi:MAG: hypothetical protein E6R13_01115 [Spirochaetes bacterium]|nr:MAG: hypothetical protein E6R13_01115 [Spirochaetota bacterium]
MKDFSYYAKSTVSYPVTKNYTKYFVYSEGKLVYETEYGEEVPSVYKHYTIEKKVDITGFQLHMKYYADELSKLYDEFKLDLFKELGIEDNPKREMLFDKVRSISDSFSSIYEYASDLVDLIL